MSIVTRSLGDIADEVEGTIRTGPFGSQLHESDYVDKGIPVVMPKNIVGGKVSTADIAKIREQDLNRLNQHKLRTGDIVYGRRGDIGRRALISDHEDGWLCGTGCLRISLNGSILDPTFLYYYLGQPSIIGWIYNQAVGATMPNLNTSILRSVPIAYPSFPMQRKIATVLSAYDDLIENNARRIEILEEMAQAIYREWFVNFRFPGRDKVGMVKSELGPLPENWQTTPFSGVADFINGFAFKPRHWGESGKPIVKIAELKNGVTSGTPRYHGGDIAPKHRIQNGDLLFSWSADLNAYIWSRGEALLNQHLFNVVPKNDVSRLFLFYALKDRMHEFRSRSQGTTMRHIKRSALDEVKLIVPPSALSSNFDQYVEPLISQVENLQTKIVNLRRTRDLLLPKLISGEVSVEEVEIGTGDSSR